jgi:hypothetical protein
MATQRTVSQETRDKVLRSALTSRKAVRVTSMTGTQRTAWKTAVTRATKS